ncbi:MAG: sialidase family protein [Bryobacteraceae bacterium]
MQWFTFAALIGSIASVGTTQPDRQPAIAAARGRIAVVFGSGNSIWLTTSNDDGRHFSPSTEVARLPLLALGRHRGPRVAFSGGTIVVTAIYGTKAESGVHTHGSPSDGDLVAWRSDDGGHSWTKPVVINDVSGSAREGLHALAAGSDGRLAAVWLDLRAPGTRLMGSYSNDGGETWSANTLLYSVPNGTICQCCAPSLVFDEPGATTVMFRNALAGTRDMFVLNWSLGQKPSEARRLGTGSWRLNACPMDGGAISRRGGSVITAWRRDKTVYLAQPGQQERAIGEGKDVTVAYGARGAYSAWSSKSGLELHTPGRDTPRLLSPTGAFAAMAALPNGCVLVAWEEKSGIQFETVK